ncbi:MAG TPA: hypothetical protein VHN14_20335 [Kofleriaceae bacterium]|jgi:hypothetical protein|nr:hypothetical protein [Kofleriaceae bacterium]
MTERRLTFIDVDENPLVVWLKEDRIQLSVIDSRPELEAGELRGFVVALFATYVGAQLATRLDSARKKISSVRDKLTATAGVDELIAALDGSLNAIEDVKHVITAAGTVVAREPEPAARAEPVAPVAPSGPAPYSAPAAPPEAPARWGLTAARRFGKSKPPGRAGEGVAPLGWAGQGYR